MKKYVRAYHTGPYSGEALETYNKLTNGLNSYQVNKFYVNEEYGKIFYINNSGFLHVLEKENGCVEDYMLTKDNMLKYSSTYCQPKYHKRVWEEFKEMIKNAPRV